MNSIVYAGFFCVLTGLVSGCSARNELDYTYPNSPYYISRDDCGSAGPTKCAEARAQAKVITGDAAAATWGSLVALTLLASIDIEPENGR
jgi:hypothetical protein